MIFILAIDQMIKSIPDVCRLDFPSCILLYTFGLKDFYS